jgi:hypothetical protein
MSRANPQIRNFAERLSVFEARRNRSIGTKTPAVFEGFEKLRPQLVPLMGTGGFQVLLARALALARSEVPWLRAVQVNEDGSLAGLEAVRAQTDPAEFLEGGVVLLSRLLGLLVAFIGENLTLRLLREAWPNVPLNDLDWDDGSKKNS